MQRGVNGSAGLGRIFPLRAFCSFEDPGRYEQKQLLAHNPFWRENTCILRVKVLK